jgi:levanbiose-producing levanase
VRGKTIRYDVGSSELRCEKYAVKLPADNGRLKLRILVDNRSVDVCAGDDGLFYMPIFFAPLKSRKLNLSIEGGSVKLDHLRVHQLKSIWQ